MILPLSRRKARLIQIASNEEKNMAANALSRFSRIFGRRSAVVIGMIHVQALPGNKLNYTSFLAFVIYLK